MHNKILKSIFQGNFLLWEQKFTYTQKQKELAKKIEDERTYFSSKLNDEEKIRFENYHNLLHELDSEVSETNNYDNFVLGISVGLEIAEHTKNILDKN